MKKTILVILSILNGVNFVHSLELYESIYEWKIRGRESINPVSFFAMHGYVNSVFVDQPKECTKGYFNGLEIHLVTAPSGAGAADHGSLTIALTAANVKLNLYKKNLNEALGTCWSPFGIHNSDWLGAKSLSHLIS